MRDSLQAQAVLSVHESYRLYSALNFKFYKVKAKLRCSTKYLFYMDAAFLGEVTVTTLNS